MVVRAILLFLAVFPVYLINIIAFLKQILAICGFSYDGTLKRDVPMVTLNGF